MLSSLHSKTKEEQAEMAERAALSGMSTVNKDTWPDSAEMEAAGKLREQFKEQIEKRKGNGTDWEFYFGDVNLVRILRGNDDSVELAGKWMTRLFKTFDEFPIDTWAKAAKEKVDAGQPVAGSLSDCFGLNPDSGKHINYKFDSERRTLSGDLIMYCAIADLNKKALADLDAAGWQNYADAWRQQSVFITALLDKESRKQNRVVKYYLVFDFKYTTITGQMNKAYDEKLDKDIGKFGEATAAEQIAKVVCVNTPWWVGKLYKAMTKLLPDKFTAKVQVCESDDGTLEKIASPEVLQSCFATRIGTMAGRSGEPKGDVEVGPASDFEYSTMMKTGQTISWKFSVAKGSGDGMMGVSDLRFGGFVFWTGERPDDGGDADEGTGGEVLVPNANVTADDGEVEGEIEISADSIVTLRWDNYHSAMRGKSLHYEITVQ